MVARAFYHYHLSLWFEQGPGFSAVPWIRVRDPGFGSLPACSQPFENQSNVTCFTLKTGFRCQRPEAGEFAASP